MSAPARERALLLLVTATGAGGAVVLAAAAWLAVEHAHPVTPYLLLLLVTTGLTDVAAVDVRLGRHSESFTWAELNVVLGLALLPADHFLLTACAIGAAYLAAGQTGLKWVHNVGSYAVGLALAVAACYAVTTPSWDRPVLSAVALTAGAAAFAVWNKVAIDAAIALAQSRTVRSVVLSGWTSSVVVFVVSVGLALTCLSATQDAPLMVGTAPAFLVATALVNRWYLRLVQERASWQHLEAAARELVALEVGTLADVALRRSVALTQADGAELRLRQGSQDVVHRLRDGNAERTRAPRTEPPDRLTVSVTRDLTDRGRSRETTTATVPLGDTERLGTLSVTYDAAVQLSRRERSQLATYAGTLSVALANARLHAQVQAHAEEYEFAALHDHLTGLPNRKLLRTRVQQLLDAGRHFAVLVVDLDRFKPVNDAYGHLAGDAVLRSAANRLRAVVRPTDTVARIGGDEFVVVVDDARQALEAAERLRTALAAPVDLGTAEVQVGGSVGIAVHPRDGRTIDALLDAADDAMYAQKRRASRAADDALPGPRQASVLPLSPRRSSG